MMISAEQHLDFINAQPSASFLQTPAWAQVKSEWKAEHLGFFLEREGGRVQVGAALVLYRQLPKVQRYLAYLPEGPVLADWGADYVLEALDALAQHVKRQGAFGLRIGPTVVARRWRTETIKTAIADPAITRLSEAPADETNPVAVRLVNTLLRAGWKAPKDEHGFSAGQPRFNFQLPLAHADGTPKTEEELLKGFNQLWRRNIKKAAKLGVEVTHGERADLAAFHELYGETAERDGFTPRPLPYFEVMWDALTAEDPDRMRLYLARHEGDLVAATTWVRVGEHTWYSYGASSSAKREVRGSNAIQWQMIRDALAAGAHVYDLRGITEGLAEDDPEIGLIQFKVGTGGEAVEYVGEWDLPLNKLLYTAFDLYMGRKR